MNVYVNTKIILYFTLRYLQLMVNIIWEGMRLYLIV